MTGAAVPSLVQRAPAHNVALLAPGRRPLTYGELGVLIQSASQKLLGAGIRRGDRVALVASNGPEMASAFLSITAAGSCAPLNPAYTAEEFAFFLGDLRPAALVLQEGIAGAAAEAALKLAIKVICLRADRESPAGAFTLAAGEEPISRQREPDTSEALVLHTSGTTSRPKLVPLSHANLLASARHIRESLQLTPADRCLNVMPLFHVHGLVAALLASLDAGASVACCPGFAVPAFFGWLEELRPTWYTAVPTMHQAVLEAAPQHADVIAKTPLRFIRSCSAALAPSLMAALESAFNAPVIEAYGMTEAAHQMASNPLPPRARKPGSVGIAAGPEVAVMDDVGTLLPAGSTGEVVTRGPNVFAGYEANAEANARAFTNGWFRTGDQGYLDGDGYLFLTGRLKELINRGGEKFAPREIDEVLLSHPAVAQAVAFAVPHSRLGEAVAAAVVLKHAASEQELRRHAAASLAHYKVPERIFTLDSLPKGPTGKLQRIGLAARLGITEADLSLQPAAPAGEPPRDSREAGIARIFAQVLNLPQMPGRDDNFFLTLSGTSLQAAALVARVSAETGVAVAPERFYANPTVAGLAAALEGASSQEEQFRFLVAIRPAGNYEPLICIPGSHGNVAGFFHLARHLHPERPVYALRLPGSHDFCVEDVVAEYLPELRAAGLERRCVLLGVCSGGPIAVELARALGGSACTVALLDSYNPGALRQLSRAEVFGLRRRHLAVRVAYHASNLRRAGLAGCARYLAPRLRAFLHQRTEDAAQVIYSVLRAARLPVPVRLRNPIYAVHRAVRAYRPEAVSSRGLLLRVEEPRADAYAIEAMGWGNVFARGVEIFDLPGNHLTALSEPHVALVAGVLDKALDDAAGALPNPR
ncbi:MAG: AMP-binding protein [bacterium]